MITLDEKQIEELLKIDLNSLKSGDTNNGVYLKNYEDEGKKRKMIMMLAKASNPTDAITDTIFTQDINDDVYRRITSWLTFANIISKMHGEDFDADPRLLYFALLVNYNAGQGKGVSKISSMDRLFAAKRAAGGSGTPNYIDYVVNGPEEDSKFDGDYKAIKVSPSGFSTGMTVELPIIKGLFGATYKFATGNDRVAGKIHFDCDSNATDYIIPANIWMSMIKDAISHRKSCRFTKFSDFGNLSKLIRDNPRDIINIMGINGITKKESIMNIYKNDIDEDGNLFLHNIREDYPELSTSGLEWEQTSYDSPNIKLKTKKEFYIINSTANSLDVYLP